MSPDGATDRATDGEGAAADGEGAATEGAAAAGAGGALDPGEIERLAGRLDALLRWITEQADPEVTDAVAELLEGVQRVHGEALRRLAGLLAEDDARWGRALADPVVSSLFELYELQVAPGGGSDRSPPDPGGISPTGDVSIVPEERLVQLERRRARGDERARAAAEQEAAAAEQEAAAAERIAEIPLDELAEGSLFASLVDDTPILVVRLEKGVLAYRNACPGSPLPLHVGRVDGATLVCPWHGCRFDLRSGERESGEGRPLDRLPSRVGEGRVRVLVP